MPRFLRKSLRSSLALPFLLAGCLAPQKKISPAQSQLIEETEQYFNQKPYEKGEFTQTGNVRTGAGSFVFEPGHLCLNYKTPKSGFLYVDAQHLINLDPETGARTSLQIQGTPFASFLKFPVKFSAKELHFEDIHETAEGYEMTLSKKYRMKKALVTLSFAGKDGKRDLNGLKASIAGYHLEVFFQKIEKEKARPAPLCVKPS